MFCSSKRGRLCIEVFQDDFYLQKLFGSPWNSSIKNFHVKFPLGGHKYGMDFFERTSMYRSPLVNFCILKFFGRTSMDKRPLGELLGKEGVW